MNHITYEFANSLIKLLYKQNQDSIEEYNVGFDDFKKLFDHNFLKRSITLANDIMKHPGKYGSDIAKNLKYCTLTEKKMRCLNYASVLIDISDKDISEDA